MNKRTFKRYVRENGIDDKSREFFKKEFLDGMEIKKEDLDYLINLHLGMKSVKYLNIIKKMGSNFSKENYKKFLEFRKKNKYDSNSKEFYQIIYGENWEEKYNENREKNSHILENLKENFNLTKITFRRYVKKYGIDNKSRIFFKKEYLDGMEIKKEDLDYLINLYLKMKDSSYLKVIKKMGSNFNKKNYERYLKFIKMHKYEYSSKKYFQIIYGEDWEEKYNKNCKKISKPKTKTLKKHFKKNINLTKITFRRYIKKNGIDDKSRIFFKKEYLDGMEIKKEDLDYLINLYLGMKEIYYLKVVKKMGSNFNKENFEKYLEFKKEHKYGSNSKEYYQIVYGKDWKEKYNEFCEKISEANSLKGYIKKYGEEGKKKWNEFCKKNSENNSLKGYIKKYGEEGKKKWNEYCKKQSKSHSLEGYIEKYGEEEGKKRWNKYYKKMLESHTLKGYIKNFGEKEGKRKWKEYCKKESEKNSLQFYIKKYGEKEGPKKRKEHIYKFTCRGSSISKASIRFFDKLNTFLEDNLMYGKGKELYLSDGKHNYFYDATYKNKYVIEFHGDVFHGNPEKFGPDDHCHPFDKNITAKQLWEHDAKKKKVAEDNGYIYICFWEHEKPENAYKKLLEMGIK